MPRFYGVDAMRGDMPGWNPYHYTFNNPVRFVDPTGMMPDIYFFDSNGEFTHKKEAPGEHIGVVVDDNNSFVFSFIDPVNDPEAIDKDQIDGVVGVSSEAIDQAITESGVDDVGFGSKLLFAWNQSRGGDGGEGKMDFVVSSSVMFDGETPGIQANKLYITNSSSGKVGQNDHNFGNFLWGGAMNRLGISLGVARTGAHVDALINEPRLDSKDDQRSIRIGYKSQNK